MEAARKVAEMSLSIEAIITIVSYLILITAYIVRLRSEVLHLKETFIHFNTNHDGFLEAFSKLREDYARLDTKIEMLLKSKTSS